MASKTIWSWATTCCENDARANATSGVNEKYMTERLRGATFEIGLYADDVMGSAGVVLVVAAGDSRSRGGEERLIGRGG
jgi:hypothetical protein